MYWGNIRATCQQWWSTFFHILHWITAAACWLYSLCIWIGGFEGSAADKQHLLQRSRKLVASIALWQETLHVFSLQVIRKAGKNSFLCDCCNHMVMGCSKVLYVPALDDCFAWSVVLVRSGKFIIKSVAFKHRNISLIRNYILRLHPLNALSRIKNKCSMGQVEVLHQRYFYN